MKVLITGNKGFIGRNFWRKLDTSRNMLYGADVKDGRDCRKLFRKEFTKFDLVIHAAAVVGGRDTIENNPIVVADNLSIDAELFQWAVKSKPKKIVYFSSSAVYPINLQEKSGRKLKESDINISKNVFFVLPDKTYGWAKLTGELLCHEYQQKYGGKVFIPRVFSGYGTDQDLNYPFPSLIKRGVNKESPFVIWGDGKQVRDFIHVEDIINSVFSVIKNDITIPINIGNGVPVSFQELAHLIIKKSNYSANIKPLKNKPQGVFYRVSDPTIMKSIFMPKISLEEGIDRALKGIL